MNNFQRRRQYLLKSPIQRRFLFHSTIMILLPTAFVGSLLFFLIFYLLSDQIMIPEHVVATLGPVITKLKYILILGGIPLVAVLLGWAIIISHRLAGPIYRLEQDLEKIAEGNHSVRVKFRKNDRLDPLAEKINRVLEKLPKT
ncbi:MAG: methyl-accepting chemotaxis protein [Deltaproteobacteria bacterium]|nr:methyl-accepting chemotaxis protein [Deltaproteobacteria bacterium]